MLGMVIGVWAVITLVAIGEGASHDAQEEIKSLGARNVIIRSIKPPSMREQMQGDWESFFRRWMAIYGLKRTDASRIKDTVPGVTRVLPLMTKRMTAIHGPREIGCQLIGTYPYYPEFTQAQLVAGQFLNEAEENSKVSSCVISLELAQRLFAGHNPLMERIVVSGYESSQVFQVKACYRSGLRSKNWRSYRILWGKRLPPTCTSRCLVSRHYMVRKMWIGVWGI